MSASHPEPNPEEKEAEPIQTNQQPSVDGSVVREAVLAELEERVSRLEDVCEDLSERVLRLGNEVESLRQQGQKLLEQASQLQPASVDERPTRPRDTWLIVDIWRDIQLTWQMFRDYRYRVDWTTSLLGLGALLYLTVWPAIRSWLGWGWSIPVVSYVDNLIVAYLGLKGLSRELRRYEHFLQVRGSR